MFHGSIPALVTPFKNGAVDRDAFAALVERQIAGGSSALVPVGTTGETSTLSTQEHKDVVTLCVEITKGRVPVIAGAGANATDEAIELVEQPAVVLGTVKLRLARVSATVSRRSSAQNPTPARPSRTHDSTTASFSRPWKESTV